MRALSLDRAFAVARKRWRDDNLAERSIGNYERALRRLDREVDGILPSPDLPRRLRRWRERQQARWRAGEISASHVSGDRSALVSFYNALVAKGLLEDNPARALPGVPSPGWRPRPIPLADQERMLTLPDLDTEAGLRDRAVLECLRHGMRQGEIVGLRVSGVSYDERAGALFLEFQAKGKRRKRRVRDVPLEATGAVIVARYLLDRFGHTQPKDPSFEGYMAEVQRLLKRLKDRDDVVFLTDTGRPLYQVWVNRMFNGYRDAAGVDPKYTCHTFRHRFCTTLLDNDVDLRRSMRLSGHEDVRSLMRYTEVARKGAVAGIGVLGATPGSKAS